VKTLGPRSQVWGLTGSQGSHDTTPAHARTPVAQVKDLKQSIAVNERALTEFHPSPSP